MTSLKEMKQRDYIPNKTYLRMIVNGVLSFIYILLTNLKDVKKITNTGQSVQHYYRPPRCYDLPEYKDGMKHCTSDEKYLRPTLWCDCRSEKIIALANHLGAYQKSDMEFAEAAFEWVKRNIILEIVAMDTVDDTLERGSGTCIHINSVLAALCRCAGIKTRYKLFSAITSQATYENMFDSMTRKWYDALGYFSIEGDVELFIDGKWIVGHAGPTPERQAAMNVPITKLGEESIGIWFDVIPGTIFLSESVPYGFGFTLMFLNKIAEGTVDSINVNTLNMIETGKKIIEEKGGETAYDKMVRENFTPRFPKVTTTVHRKIVFEK
jgi:hypothetical protein